MYLDELPLLPNRSLSGHGFPLGGFGGSSLSLRLALVEFSIRLMRPNLSQHLGSSESGGQTINLMVDQSYPIKIKIAILRVHPWTRPSLQCQFPSADF